MGSQSPQSLKQKISYYSTEMHPIEGQVDVYQLKGESLFIISNTKSSKKSVELAQLVQAQKSMSLVNYFGNSINNQNARLNTNCKILLKEEYTLYWGYYNYDLAAQTIKNLKQNMKVEEKCILAAAESCILGALALKKHNLFMQFSSNNVQIAPDRTIKLYWGNMQFNNGHRSYFKGFSNGFFDQVFYSPEQLTSIQSNKLNHRIDLEKASVFSLGIVLLCFACSFSNQQELYQYSNFQIKENAINSFLNTIKLNYSEKIFKLMSAMLQFDPVKRISFSNIKSLLLQKEQKKADISKVISMKERRYSDILKKGQMKLHTQSNLNIKNLRS